MLAIRGHSYFEKNILVTNVIFLIEFAARSSINDFLLKQIIESYF